MFVHSSFGWRPPIANKISWNQRSCCWKVAVESPVSPVFRNISIICLKFAIKLIYLLLGQSRLFYEPNLHFVFVTPLRTKTKYYNVLLFIRHLDLIVMENQPNFAIGVTKLCSSVALLKCCCLGGLCCVEWATFHAFGTAWRPQNFQYCSSSST